MKARRVLAPLVLMSAAALALAGAAAASGTRGPIGNKAVPEPAKPVDLNRYAGLWYELGRYENSFERNCEAVTADYRLLDNGAVQVVNSCRKGGVDGPAKTIKGRAKVVPGSQNAKLKVSFFGPFFGDYWVLDHADDYAWSIVGEPSGRYLWLLSRTAEPAASVRETIQARVRDLGYDTDLIRPTRH
jgi:apolipoprotein D and lipocalin family protein